MTTNRIIPPTQISLGAVWIVSISLSAFECIVSAVNCVSVCVVERWKLLLPHTLAFICFCLHLLHTHTHTHTQQSSLRKQAFTVGEH